MPLQARHRPCPTSIRSGRDWRARTPTSCGGTAMPPRPTAGPAGRTPTPRPPAPTTTSWRRAPPGGHGEPEDELLDTGVFDHGHRDITIDHAKAAPNDLCIRVTVVNAGGEVELRLEDNTLAGTW